MSLLSEYDRFSHDLPRFIVFLIGSNCVVFHFYFALSRQPVMKTNQVGTGNSIRMYVSHVLSTKTGTQTCVNLVIRYIMQDVGLNTYICLPIMKQIFKAVSDIWQKKQRESSVKCTVKSKQ